MSIKEEHVALALSIKKRFHSTNYQLIEMIGQGGFGIVYKAKQISTDQVVAIKFLTLTSEFDSNKRKRYLERFQRETALSSRLQHPNIVRLLDKGVCDDDLVYAVFEYVDGISLKQHLTENGALLPADTANLMGQVLDALSHAHDQGVIHRDLKPANIMLSRVGTKDHIKILDFGIGTLSNEVRQHDYKSITLTHETLGTPSYSAPEQLRGESPSIKSDIYVWGLVFIECLTGEPAITGNSLASIFHKQLSLSNVPIPTAVAGHPVANLLRRVLNKKVNERAGDASLIYHDLKQININSLVGDISTSHKATSSVIQVEASDNSFDINKLNKIQILNNKFDINNTLSAALEETQINTGLALNTSMIERKQISILCVSLTLKSLNDSQVDDSDLELLDVLHRDSKSQCIDIAVRYGAYHAGSLGDTILFYFGYPSVSDNDSRLCARTALDITSNINQRNALLKNTNQLEIQARMGMHTGLVSHYADAMPEGGAINVAMELARLSRPRQVLCSQASKRLLEGYIEFKMALNHNLGTKKEAEAVHQLVGERLNEAFGFLRGTRSVHAFVGREEELDTLKHVFDDTNDDTPSYIHIHGEAGIGKSRLIYEVRELTNKFHHYMCQCLPEHRYSGLHPILSVIKNKYNLNNLDGTDSTALVTIKNILQKNENLNSKLAMPILLSWLNIPLPEGLEIEVLSPEVQKKMLYDAIISLLLTDCSVEKVSKRIMFICEDMHWSDPTTLEFLKYLLGHELFKKIQPILIVSSRESIGDKFENNQYLDICLKRIDASKSKEFIYKFFGCNNVSNKVYEEIIKRTDGVPLFIEELLFMMKNKNIIHHLNGVIDFVHESSIKNIPDTLVESLQYKIDSLTTSKETAQIAAVIGREFDHELLALVTRGDRTELRKNLNELLEKDIIYVKRHVYGDKYIFKHALIRDAFYSAINPDVKEVFHENIAITIEENKLNLLDSDVFSLIYHYQKCYKNRKVVFYSVLAVKKTIEIADFKQAIFFSNNALKYLKGIEHTVFEKLNIYHYLITSTMMLYGWASGKVEIIINHVKELISSVNEKEIPFSIFWTIATYYEVRGIHNKCQSVINMALDGSLDEDDQSALHALKSHSLWTQGNLDESLNNTKIGLKKYSGDVEHVVKYGHDSKVFLLSVQALIYSNLGEKNKSKKAIIDALHHAESLNNPHSICMSKVYQCCCMYQNKDVDGFIEIINEVSEITNKYQLGNWNGTVSILKAWYLKDLTLALSALKEMKDSGLTEMQGYWNSMIADIEISKGEFDNANSRIECSIEHTKKSGELLFLDELNRLKLFVNNEMSKT